MKTNDTVTPIRHSVTLPNFTGSHHLEGDKKNKVSNILQMKLMEMGFDIQLVNNILFHFEVSSLENALSYLLKIDGCWGHPYVTGEEPEEDKCMICSEPSRVHAIDFLRRSYTISHNISTDPSKYKKTKTTVEIHMPVVNSTTLSSKVHQLSCNICLSEIDDNNSFKSPCQHNYCTDCMTQYIKNKINSSEVEEIFCPEGRTKCQRILSENEIQSLLNQKDFERYLKFLNRAKISKIPNAVHCPISDCDSYALVPSKEQGIRLFNFLNKTPSPFLTCVENHHQFCNDCKNPAHPGGKCESKLEKDFKIWAEKQHVKRCPKCGFYIQKNEGCNHMTCANKECRHQFCWLCLSEYTPTHYSERGPCFGMQFTSQQSIFIRYPLLRNLHVPLGIAALLGLVTLVITLISLILGLGLIAVVIIQARDFLKRHLIKIILGLICLIAISPLGLMILIIGILTSPIICIAIVFYKCRRRRNNML